MPDVGAGVGLQHQQAVRVEVVALAVAAPEVERRRSGRQEDQAALDVDGDAAPRVGAADALPGIGRPGLVARLARLRDGVERPGDRAGADVVGAHVARRRRARALADARALDQQVLVDRAGRVGDDVERLRPVAEAGAQIDAALAAEALDRPAGRRVEREQGEAGADQDARVAAAFALPVDDAAVDAEPALVGARGERIEHPLLLAGGGVQREHLELRRRGVEHAADHDRVALDLRAAGPGVAGVVRPRHLQRGDVRRRDLIERGGLRVRGVGAVRGPVDGAGDGGRRRRLAGQAGDERRPWR